MAKCKELEAEDIIVGLWCMMGAGGLGGVGRLLGHR